MQLWDLATRRRLAGPLGHLGVVKGVAFRPDGKAMLTASFDGHARLGISPAWGGRPPRC